MALLSSWCWCKWLFRWHFSNGKRRELRPTKRCLCRSMVIIWEGDLPLVVYQGLMSYYDNVAPLTCQWIPCMMPFRHQAMASADKIVIDVWVGGRCVRATYYSTVPVVPDPESLLIVLRMLMSPCADIVLPWMPCMIPFEQWAMTSTDKRVRQVPVKACDKKDRTLFLG
jgi:hypothetical protein